ncbi:hypothetical protein [Mesorhizobium sp. DCY119]|uniref:hypothetical protein n=1 Tax=Mesorhizobium sp. DCY119 TaxID=2108445 RepID=UPI0013C4DA48|nr:hypothetical protein [Mesorhizobium sp. DCY119]
MKDLIDQMETHAGELRNHIAKIRIDYPEAADARRMDLRQVYRKIAEARRALESEAGR